MHPILGFGLLATALVWLFDNKDSKIMSAVQTQFLGFHDNIKLDIDDEKANLRNKREVLLSALRANLPEDVPTFEHFHQGSYSMHTGVVPLDGNYDIDVGLIFDCQRDKYPDPVVLKKIVRDALNTHGRTINIRRPCVTVNYMRAGVPEYHVDLAIYVKRNDSLIDIAKGKENSEQSKRFWEATEPKALTALVCSRFIDAAELAQYRRCIRYMKRWRDVQFYSGAPLSIALTLAAYKWFTPIKTTNGTYLDLLAMLDWTKAILANFELCYTDDGLHSRLKVVLPVTPGVDIMGWMTKGQMATFKSALEGLRNALDSAYDETLPEAACQILAKHFGSDFPIPVKSQTARTVGAPVIHTGSSA